MPFDGGVPLLLKQNSEAGKAVKMAFTVGIQLRKSCR
jgi:hypothetical protein